MSGRLVLSGDSWSGVSNNRWEIVEPDLDAVMRAVEELDGRTRTEVGLSREEPFEYVSASGGPELFLVTGETASGAIVQLKSTGMGEELVSLVCGGQRADFALGDLVHLADAREALRLFIAGFPEELPDGWAVDE